MKGIDIMTQGIGYYKWFDNDGTKWTYEPTWDGCDVKLSDEPFDSCPNHIEWLGVKRNGVQVNLCGEHFEEIRNKAT
jgi:hypothetical protein